MSAERCPRCGSRYRALKQSGCIPATGPFARSQHSWHADGDRVESLAWSPYRTRRRMMDDGEQTKFARLAWHITHRGGWPVDDIWYVLFTAALTVVHGEHRYDYVPVGTLTITPIITHSYLDGTGLEDRGWRWEFEPYA